MDTSVMKYPFGRCGNCGKIFNSKQRNVVKIDYCPRCSLEIDDFMTTTNRKSSDDIYCEDCGTLINRRQSWVYHYDHIGPGVCSGPCERELCGKCGDWDEEGCCPKCREKPIPLGVEQ